MGFGTWNWTKNSSDLKTFMTPFGRFTFNRVPFGINSAPEIFQSKMVLVFGDIPGVLVYFDDIGIAAESEREHDEILAVVMERARINNVRFNPDKIQYRKSEVKFMGHILSNGQIRPDGKYREAILKIKKPENKQDVMRLLGLFKYLAKFIPNLSKQSAALRDLTRNDVEFDWTEAHEGEMGNLLSIITSEPVMSVYDPKELVVVQTDASKDGLGFRFNAERAPTGVRFTYIEQNGAEMGIGHRLRRNCWPSFSHVNVFTIFCTEGNSWFKVTISLWKHWSNGISMM